MRGLIGLSLAALASASPVLVDSIHNEAATVLSASNAKEIPDNYIVVFKKHVNPRIAALHHSWVGETHGKVQSAKIELRKRSQTPMVDDIYSGLKHTYNIAGSFLGYSGHFDEDVIEQIRRHPDVSSTRSLAQAAARHLWLSCITFGTTLYSHANDANRLNLSRRTRRSTLCPMTQTQHSRRTLLGVWHVSRTVTA